jgi:acetyl-CoA acetyltransferase
VIADVFNTPQALRHQGETGLSICLSAVQSLLGHSGLDLSAIDGIYGSWASQIAYSLRLGPLWIGGSRGQATLRHVLEAAAVIEAGLCSSIVIVEGRAGESAREGASTAPWTRPANEFTAPFGLYTAVEFALVARTHMELYGTTPEQLATVAATIRNNGHVNPDAVYRGRGPFTAEDVLASRMIADPFHLLDCAMTAEGACAILLTRADMLSDLNARPARILGGASESFGPAYSHPPRWNLAGRRGSINGTIGADAAKRAFAMAGLRHEDISCCELYDPFSFEIIRQLEAFGFCEPGEAGPFVEEGNIGPGGRLPVTTDGGLLSYSHARGQMLQRATRAVEQLNGTCKSGQVPGASAVLCSAGGGGAMFSDVLILGAVR